MEPFIPRGRGVGGVREAEFSEGAVFEEGPAGLLEGLLLSKWV